MKNIFFCCILLFGFTKFLFSQEQNDFEKILDGSILLKNDIEYYNIVDNIENGLFVEVKIDNKSYKFLVDTGASLSLIHDDLDIKMEPSNTKILTADNFGRETEKELFKADFYIGENLFKGFSFIKQDFSSLRENSCLNFDGILGINVLKKLNWKIIKEDNKLLFSKQPFSYVGFENPIEIKWYNYFVPLVELNFNKSNFFASLDTGFFGKIKLSEEIYNSYFDNYKKLVKGKGQSFYSMYGKVETDVRKANIKNLSLGKSYVLQDIVVIIDKSKPLIGKDILFSRSLIFNFLNNEMAFKKNEESNQIVTKVNSNFKVCRTGQNNQEIELCFFWDENKYRDLKIGDKIIKIDNFDTSNITDDEYCNLLSYLRTKQSLNITVKRGNKNFEYTLN